MWNLAPISSSKAHTGRRTMALVGLFVFLAISPLFAATYYVDASRPDDTGDGQSWAAAKKTVKAGIALLSAADDELRIAQGTYTYVGSDWYMALITTTNDCTIKGGFRGGTAGDGDDWDVEAFPTNINPLNGYTALVLNTGIKLTLIGINFEGVQSGGDGSGQALTVYGAGASLDVQLCNIKNFSHYSGGGINCGTNTNMGTVEITSTTFTGNWNVSTNAQYYRGAGAALRFFGVNLILENCEFTNNLSRRSGGAIFVGSGATVTARNCTFTGNQTTNGGGNGINYHGGGAIAGYTGMTFIDCDFSNNQSAAGRGGAVSIVKEGAAGQTATVIERCTFDQNNGGTAYGTHGGAVSIIGYYWGGTDYSASMTVDITDSTFSGNTMDEADGLGGACHFKGLTLNVTDTTFENNAQTNGNAGGHLALRGVDATFERCTFREGSAGDKGGAIAVTTDPQTLTAGLLTRDCDFQANVANHYAGLYLNDVDWTDEGSRFYGNNSSGYGGVAGVREGASADLTSTTMVGNRAEGHAGTMLVNNAAGTIDAKNCVFAGNSAGGEGGLIRADSSGNVIFTNCIVDRQRAGSHGGVVQSYGGGELSAYNTLFIRNYSQNSADDRGGALKYWNTTTPGKIYNCAFVINGRGAIVEAGGTENPELKNNLFMGNWGGPDYSDGSADYDTEDELTSTALVNGNGVAWWRDSSFDNGFRDSVEGTWTAVSTDTLTMTLTDSTASWTPGALAGKFIVPRTSGGYDVLAHLIISNTATSVVIDRATRSDDYVEVGHTYLIPNYQPHFGSILVDNGTSDAPAPSEDIAEDTRPYGSANDVGPYEFSPQETVKPDIAINRDGSAITRSLPVGFTITLTEPVIALETTDISWGGTIASGDIVFNLTEVSGTEYSLSVTSTSGSAGTLIPSVAADAVYDYDANGNNASTGTNEVEYDPTLAAVYVDISQGDDSGDGLTWATAKKYYESGIGLLRDEDTLYVATGTYEPSTHDVTVSTVTIQGGYPAGGGTWSVDDNPTTLSGVNQSASAPWITVSGSNVAFVGVNFRDGGSFTLGDRGFNTRAVKVTGESASFSHCDFVDNKVGVSTGGGAAVYMADGDLSFADCAFNNNTGYADASSQHGKGGAVFKEGAGQLTLTGCSFTGNNATPYSWSGNPAVAVNYWGGGAVCAQSYLVATDCVFTGNYTKAGATGTGAAGGAIGMTAGGEITGCTFTANESRETNTSHGPCGGGAIAFTGGAVTIADCVFDSNEATDSGGIGGALLVGAENTISGCTFRQNEAASDGGTIYSGEGAPAAASVSTEDCLFQANNAGNYGGGVCVRGQDWTDSGSMFCSNRPGTGWDGGACYARDGAVISLTGTTLAGNRARNGGGIAITSGSLTADGCKFVYNYAVDSSGGEGGAIRAGGGASVVLTNCILDRNIAVNHGGAVQTYHTDPYGELSAYNSLFVRNYTSNAGENRAGALKFWNTTASEVVNCAFLINGRGSIVEAAGTEDPVLKNNVFQHTWGGPDYNDGGALYDTLDELTSTGLIAGNGVAWQKESEFDMGFEDAVTGTWTAVTTDSLHYYVTDSSASWTPGALVGQYVIPRAEEADGYYGVVCLILDNGATTMTLDVTGRTDSFFSAGDSYEIPNYQPDVTSLLVENGTNDSAPAVDILGVARPKAKLLDQHGVPQGTPLYDIGPYEFEGIFFGEAFPASVESTWTLMD